MVLQSKLNHNGMSDTSEGVNVHTESVIIGLVPNVTWPAIQHIPTLPS